MKLRILFVAMLLIAAAFPTFAQDDDPTVLTVNGDDITASTFGERTLFEFAITEQLARFRLQALERQAQQYGVTVQQFAQQDQQFQRWLEELQDPTVLGLRVLDTMGNETLLEQYAAENDITFTEEDTLAAQHRFFGYDPTIVTEEQTELYNEFVATFTEEIVAMGATEADLSAFYERQALAEAVRVAVSGQDEYLFTEAAHILVAEEDEANAILALINDGEDFAALATERSLDPGSGANGGVLGDSPVLYYVAPFANAIRDGEVGEIVGPVESQFGFHIIRIDSKEMRAVEDPQQAEQLEGLAFQQWILDLTESGEIEIADEWAEFVVVPDLGENAAAEATPEVDAEATEEAGD